jgi:hypothetical protein
VWIVKGTFLGIWLFSFSTIVFLYLVLSFGELLAGMVDVALITHLTTHNPLWWTALATCLAIGLLITRSWSGKPLLWIALAVTELFPVAFVVVFFMLVAKNKEAIERTKDMVK